MGRMRRLIGHSFWTFAGRAFLYVGGCAVGALHHGRCCDQPICRGLEYGGDCHPGPLHCWGGNWGIHGENRLGACAVPDALVFGRIAGGYVPVIED